MSAKDNATGKEQQIRIQASGGLSDADIDAMVADAEANADEDKARRELAEAKNQAEALTHKAASDLKEHGDKIGEEEKTDIEDAIAAVNEVKDGEDAEVINAKIAELTAAVMKMGEAIYANAGEEAGATDTGGADDDDIVDAEFEDVDEDDASA